MATLLALLRSSRPPLRGEYVELDIHEAVRMNYTSIEDYRLWSWIYRHFD